MELLFLDKKTYNHYLDDIAKLFEASFQRTISLEFLKWRYLDNPSSDLLACVAIDNGRVVANYSASPCTMLRSEDEVQSALSMTTMTHPEYAGRGLFTLLATKLYDHMKTKSFNLIWGFPNNNSHRGFVKRLKWQDIYEVPTMHLSVTQSNFENRVNYIMDNDFSFQYSNVDHKGVLHVKKDQVYLQWRYANNPINKYRNLVILNGNKVTSYCVVKKYNNEIDIVDLQAASREEGTELIRQVISLSVEEELQAINCWAPRHHFIHDSCEELGFINREPITYLGARFLCDGENKMVTYNYSDWYIQMGDSDVY